MEETNRYLGLWYQENFAHWGEPNDPHTQEIVGLVHENVMQQLVMSHRVAFIGNEQDGIHQLVEAIHDLPTNRYANLTDAIMTEIVAGIREIFPDVAHCTIEHFGARPCQQRIIELFDYVRDTLYERLHLVGKKPTLPVVSRIISMVFKNLPLITKKLIEQLYRLGYLIRKTTERIEKVLDALYRFWCNPTVQDIIGNIEREIIPIIERVIAATIAERITERIADAIVWEAIIDLRILILVAVIIGIGEILVHRYGHHV